MTSVSLIKSIRLDVDGEETNSRNLPKNVEVGSKIDRRRMEKESEEAVTEDGTTLVNVAGLRERGRKSVNVSDEW